MSDWRAINITYRNINPELLYDEVKDFVQKQGATLADSKLQTYALPGGWSHTVRGTLIFTAKDEQGRSGEGVRVHIVGSAEGETKMMMDIDEKLFPLQKISALEEDLGFVFGACQVQGLEE